jgi:hypothetical protein
VVSNVCEVHEQSKMWVVGPAPSPLRKPAPWTGADERVAQKPSLLGLVWQAYFQVAQTMFTYWLLIHDLGL